MNRLVMAAALVLVVPLGCVSFKDKHTPSGDFCSDMPIVPAGQDPAREYHRLQPITSDPKARTEAERLESLRKVACNVGADAVIEAVNEEVRGDNAQYQTVSSGTAVIWLHRAALEGNHPKLLTVTATKQPAPTAEAAPPPPPPPPPPPTAEPAKTAKPIGGAPKKRPIAPPPAPKD